MTGRASAGHTATPEPGGDGHARIPSSENERATASTAGTPPVDRAAALRAGTTPIPRKVVIWIAAGFVVLALGGIGAEHLIGNAGVASVVTSPTTTLAGTGATSPPSDPTAPAITTAPKALLGLSRLPGRPAPALALSDQHGTSWNLTRDRGKVVVVTFFDAACDDICPVLSSEIDQADQALGPRRADVEFVVVNTDPMETTLTPTTPSLTTTGLAQLPNVTLLSGPLSDLNRVWKSYGVTVAVDRTTRLVTHSEVMDFIDPGGHLRWSATPFANENSLGIYSLPPAVVTAFANGVAQSATNLDAGRA